MPDHNEPWERVYDMASNCKGKNIFDDFMDGDDHPDLDRAVLCVNACAGMSNEEVEQLRDYTHQTVEKHLSKMADIKALKSDLAEAVGLLEGECERCYHKLGEVMDGHEIVDGVCHGCRIKPFLTRHKES